MPELAILLPLAAFIALAAGLFIVFRRTDTIARRSRELETFKAAVRELSVRIDTSLEGATSRIDAAVQSVVIEKRCNRQTALRHLRDTRPALFED